MDAYIKSFKGYYFIYAIGLFCFLNILSSEMIMKNRGKLKHPTYNAIGSGCESTINYLI